MNKEEMDQKYLDQHTQLEAEFFSIKNIGKSNQYRKLKAGKSIDVFNQKHAELWHNHEAELLAEGK